MTPEQYTILVRIDERVNCLVQNQTDQETRLRGMEKFRNRIMGGFSLIAVSLSALAAAFGIKGPPN